MKQPPLEVADIIRAQGSNFLEHSPGWFTWQHLSKLGGRDATMTELWNAALAA
jgi:hypothetical protein